MVVVGGDHFFGMNLLVGFKQGCILNLVKFGGVGAEKKWGSVLVWWFYLRKIRPTQLWVELSWVVAVELGCGNSACHFFTAPTKPNLSKFSIQPYLNPTRRFIKKNNVTLPCFE